MTTFWIKGFRLDPGIKISSVQFSLKFHQVFLVSLKFCVMLEVLTVLMNLSNKNMLCVQ